MKILLLLSLLVFGTIIPYSQVLHTIFYAQSLPNQ